MRTTVTLTAVEVAALRSYIEQAEAIRDDPGADYPQDVLGPLWQLAGYLAAAIADGTDTA